MLSWLRRSVTERFLHNPFGDRIRRGGGFTRLGDLMNRYIVSETRQIARGRQQLALAQTVEFIEARLPTVPAYDSAFDVLALGLRRAREVSGLYLEFGVFEGFTINWIAKLTDQHIYGFDSFEGLPEDWTAEHRRGAYKASVIPRVRANVSLVVGLFDQSLPGFIAEHPEKLAFVHIDSDLYSSAVTVFTLLGDRFQPGTVLVFDEYFNFPGWQEGEHHAFSELVAARGLEFEYLGYCRFGEQLALRITKVAG